MNPLFVLLIISIASSAQASVQETTVETMITCQQDEGDHWTEVGVALNDGPGLRAYIVTHHDDHAKLVSQHHVFEKNKNTKTVVFEDTHQTIRLETTKKRTRITGKLSLLQDGPGGLMLDRLLCYENSSIIFE